MGISDIISIFEIFVSSLPKLQQDNLAVTINFHGDVILNKSHSFSDTGDTMYESRYNGCFMAAYTSTCRAVEA